MDFITCKGLNITQIGGKFLVFNLELLDILSTDKLYLSGRTQNPLSLFVVFRALWGFFIQTYMGPDVWNEIKGK